MEINEYEKIAEVLKRKLQPLKDLAFSATRMTLDSLEEDYVYQNVALLFIRYRKDEINEEELNEELEKLTNEREELFLTPLKDYLKREKSIFYEAKKIIKKRMKEF